MWGALGCFRRPLCLLETEPIGEPLAVLLGIERTRTPRSSCCPELACIVPSHRWSPGSWGSVGRRASISEHLPSARHTDHLPRASQSSGKIDTVLSSSQMKRPELRGVTGRGHWVVSRGDLRPSPLCVRQGWPVCAQGWSAQVLTAGTTRSVV